MTSETRQDMLHNAKSCRDLVSEQHPSTALRIHLACEHVYVHTLGKEGVAEGALGMVSLSTDLTSRRPLSEWIRECLACFRPPVSKAGQWHREDLYSEGIALLGVLLLSPGGQARQLVAELLQGGLLAREPRGDVSSSYIYETPVQLSIPVLLHIRTDTHVRFPSSSASPPASSRFSPAQTPAPSPGGSLVGVRNSPSKDSAADP